ncbi:MAG: GNAT family N-acetyltransferase [Bacteroidetes bacterium]|nr:GNAT family N-acetyltransferase [Bacteroidota bacterium]
MITKAEITYAEIISIIGKQTFFEAHETSAPKEELENYLNESLSKEAISKELNNPVNIFHLLFHENDLAGYSKIIYNTPPPQLPDTTDACKLERIYFLQKFHGKKLGLKLFNFNKELCIQNNQSGMWLTVWIGNERAINFYEKLGFKTIGEIIFKVGNIESPNLVMWLAL